MYYNFMRVLFSDLNISFKSNVRIDVGGSRTEGSCKVCYSTSDERFVNNLNTTVNEVGKPHFNSAEEFVGLIADKIKTAQDSSRENILQSGYPESENIIQNIAIFVPSRTYKKQAMFIPNLKDFDNDPLQDVDFKGFKDVLSARGVDFSEDLNFVLLQDVLGAGLAVTKQLYNKGMLQVGNAYTACITGGGCGIADIEMTTPDWITLKCSGSACIPGESELLKVSGLGASSRTMLKIFCEALELDKDLQELINKCRKSEFVLNPTVTYKKNIITNALKGGLLQTNIFELNNETENEYTIKVKDSKTDVYKNAMKTAISSYVDAFAKLGVIKRNDSYNGLILTGPLALAVNECSIRNNEGSLAKRVEKVLYKNYVNDEFLKLRETYPYKVYCSKDFAVANNTDCGDLVHKVIFPSNTRSNWVRLNVKHLKK